MIGDHRFELIRKRGEPAWQGYAGVGVDLSVGDVTQAIAFSFDQSPTGRAKAGVEAENLQASLSSSSSGTS
jgi:hypothetical protein